MRAKYLQFFVHPSEFWRLFWDMVNAIGLYVIFARLGPTRSLQIVDMPDTTAMSDGSPPDWIFLTVSRPEVTYIDANDLHPGEWGWVQIEVPRIEGSVLLLSTLAGKYEWYDPRRNQIKGNKNVVTVFDRVARFLKRRLMRPVWARNVIESKGQCYRQIWYSAGAADWIRKGGVLQQEGVANIVYSIEG